MFGYALSVTFACGKTLYYLFVGITTVANKGKYYVVRLQYIIYTQANVTDKAYPNIWTLSISI
jgi:hypothetical protein